MEHLLPDMVTLKFIQLKLATLKKKTRIPPLFFIIYSERIPRGQAKLNRLSKSGDPFGSQFLMSHTRSDVSQQVAESIDKLYGGDATSESEQAASSITALYSNPETVEEGTPIDYSFPHLKSHGVALHAMWILR